MPELLTVNEAADRTGKSASSIRRLIYPIIKQSSHPDRSFIEPSPDQVKKLRDKGETFPWRVSDELLKRLVPADVRDNKRAESSAKAVSDGNADLIGMLRRELEIKNQQIEHYAEVISKQADFMEALGQRIGEGNILIASLHQQLALPHGNRTNSASGVADTAKTGVGESSKKSAKSSAKQPNPKRRFFLRLFRR